MPGWQFWGRHQFTAHTIVCRNSTQLIYMPPESAVIKSRIQ